jgi:hypothetical protein
MATRRFLNIRVLCPMMSIHLRRPEWPCSERRDRLNCGIVPARHASNVNHPLSMFFRRKKIADVALKLSGRDVAKSPYEIGLVMWERGIKERFLQDRAVATVTRREDETRDAISYRLPNEIDLFLGIDLSQKIRHTHRTIQDFIRALNDKYVQLIQGHAEIDVTDAELREGLIVNLLPSLKLKGAQFSLRLKDRVPDDARIIGRLLEIGPESNGAELECLNHQQEYVIGADEMGADFCIPGLADEHFGLSVQHENFFVYHIAKDKAAATEVYQAENERVTVGRQYQMLHDKNYIVATYGEIARRFQFFAPRELSDDGDQATRYRLVEAGYYVLRRPDTLKRLYHYPTIFFAEPDMMLTGVKDAQYIPLPGLKNVGMPARMSYKEGEYYFRKLHTVMPLPVKVNGQELRDDEEVQLVGDNDRIDLGNVQFAYEKISKRQGVPLAILEVSTPRRPTRRYPLFRKTMVLSGQRKMPGFSDYLFLDEPSVPHNAMRLSIADGVLYIERGKDTPPLYINDIRVNQKHPLMSGDKFMMGDLQVKVARKDLPPSYYAKLTLSAESRRPVYPLREIMRGKAYTLGRIEPDDPTECFVKISDDLHVSGSHAVLSLSTGRVASIQNTSQSNSVFIMSVDGLLRADLPQKSLTSELLLRWDRIIIGPVELEYRGPGSSIVIPDSYEA